MVLPECFAWIGPDASYRSVAERLPVSAREQGERTVLTRCQRWAKELGVEPHPWEVSPSKRRMLVPASTTRACTSARTARSSSATGRFICSTWSSPMARRSRSRPRSQAGDPTVVADDAPFGKLGLSICYDVRFPELYRKLVDQGAVALAVPGSVHAAHGQGSLARAAAGARHRVAVLRARGGADGASLRISACPYGHAMIVDPWGCVLAQCGEGEGIAVATVDTEVVDARAASATEPHASPSGLSGPQVTAFTRRRLGAGA